MLGNQWFVKMMPFQGFIGFGGGATSLLSSGTGLTDVDASGGSKTTFGDYTVHKFTSPGNFVLAASHSSIAADVLLVGGG